MRRKLLLQWSLLLKCTFVYPFIRCFAIFNIYNNCMLRNNLHYLVSPFNDCNTISIKIFFTAQFSHFFNVINSINIKMIKGKPSAVILLNNSKSRAGDHFCNPQSLTDVLCKSCFACAKVTCQGHDVPFFYIFSKIQSKLLCFTLVVNYYFFNCCFFRFHHLVSHYSNYLCKCFAIALYVKNVIAELIPALSRLNGSRIGKIIATTASLGTPKKIGVIIRFQAIIDTVIIIVPQKRAITAYFFVLCFL